jgi:hypothetical protein
MFKNEEHGRLLILDPGRVTEHDLEIIAALDIHPPSTEYKAGDLLKVRVDRLPSHVRMRWRSPDEIPLVWKVRFVISKWAFNLMSILEQAGTDTFSGIDQAITRVESTKLSHHRYNDAILYLHAFPHGMNPDSAIFLEEKNAQGARTTERFFLREVNPAWPVILDEARAPYVGFDPSDARMPITWNLAPDLYRDGENIGKPFEHEFATVDVMANSGLERLLFDKRIRKERAPIDPEHPLLVQHGKAAADD